MPRLTKEKAQQRDEHIRAMRHLKPEISYADIQGEIKNRLGISCSMSTIQKALDANREYPALVNKKIPEPVQEKKDWRQVFNKPVVQQEYTGSTSIAALRLVYEILTGKRRTATRQEYLTEIKRVINNE